MSKKFSNHLHKYKKITLGKDYKVFKCQIPGCDHYIRLELAEGKLCQCNRCGKEMVMTKAAVILTLPHCPLCTRSTKRIELNKLEDFLNEKLG